jgi:hypothetical protein
LKIRRDVFFVSGVLFTIAFLWLLPDILSAAQTGRHVTYDDPWVANAARQLGDLGVASLTIILIGLIVTWTGYVGRVRWTWFVMFVIVSGWAFPILIYPILHSTIVPSAAEILSSAFREPGLRRDFVETIVIFSLMVVALILPIKSFFGRAGSSHLPLVSGPHLPPVQK